MCLRLFALEGRPRVYMRVEGSAILCEGGGGVHRGAPRSAVCRLPSLRGLAGAGAGEAGGGARTCRPCVWEPRAPHFSYIVLPLLQTVNATKDAQPIVALGQLRGEGTGGGGSRGRRALAQPEPSMAASPPLFPSPLPSSALLSSSHFARLCHFAPLQRI